MVLYLSGKQRRLHNLYVTHSKFYFLAKEFNVIIFPFGSPCPSSLLLHGREEGKKDREFFFRLPSPLVLLLFKGRGTEFPFSSSPSPLVLVPYGELRETTGVLPLKGRRDDETTNPFGSSLLFFP